MKDKDRVFEHKGYVGSIDFSLEDKTLHGKILFINDLVNYEGENLDELKKAFIEAVEFYLDTCAEEGVEPDKPCSGTFNVRIPPALHRSAQVEAARRGLTLNDFIRQSVDNELTGSRGLTIHTHEHNHTHTHSGTEYFVAEESSSYKEITKWKHETLKITTH
ncbi:HicB family protein [Burkholderia lata]|uniref:HicB family protein n=1 Tax=Burkholderia lata (strain ATCC 17760 / DSM 23089 / LMG 22485 / NCIMB 9086 / R18194 / 383) TaxID=482957 RepID=A0A6P2TZB6_BURL3|nr:type II toxin-antitoxin system HicB family antitoxin [Burkholderia lata]VWC65423.1 HicB family protein [Burkholderia lata]